MQSIFTTHPNSRETVILRMCIVAAALLFLLYAVYQSIPDRATVQAKLKQSALAGQEEVTVTTPERETYTAVFYDRFPPESLPAPAR